VNNPKKMIKTDYYNDVNLRQYISYYKKFRIKYFNQNWKTITDIKSSGKALDFGASFGWFLECTPKTWDIVGLEPSEKAFSFARSKGINIQQGDENKLKNKKSTYDLITLWNVFEHMPDPINLLKIFNRSLKPGGLLVIAIPNRNGLISKFSYFLSKLKIYQPIYALFQIGKPSPHLFHYSAENIKNLLSATGFTFMFTRQQPVIDIENIGKRILLEKKTNSLTYLITKIGTIFTYYLSAIFDMNDEIVIYSQKL